MKYTSPNNQQHNAHYHKDDHEHEFQQKETSFPNMRLQVFIAHAGICSRRAATALIEEGRVSVNKEIVINSGLRINPEKDKVVVDGKSCSIQTIMRYFMMNKPTKVESTNISYRENIPNAKKKEEKRTVKDIISRYYDGHIYSIGRLDYHSSGLLLFTTDGTLCHHLSHPRYGVKKVYRVETKNEIPDSLLHKWLEGIRIDGELYTLEKYYKFPQDPLCVELTLTEGKNREIRAVCEQYHVLIKRLHRISLGPLKLAGLKGGLVRELSKLEVDNLYNSVKLPYYKKNSKKTTHT